MTIPLPIIRLQFVARADDVLALPRYAGSMLRGAFGHALMALAPLPHGDHDPCALGRACPYCELFNTPARPVHTLQKFSQMPHPYVVEPPTAQGPIPAGTVWHFGLVLIGKAIEHLAIIIMAWQRALHRGLGTPPARCTLLEVTLEEKQATVWHPEHQPAPALPEYSLPDRPGLSDGADLDLLTPLRLQHRGKPAHPGDLGARSLLITLARRYQLLHDLHLGRSAEQLDFRSLGELADEICLDASDLRWLDWGRYSQRQQREMKLGGLMGTVRLQGQLAPFAELLHIGQWLHIGKNASFGLGRYRLQRGAGTCIAASA